MTVSSTVDRQTFACNGSTVAFTCAFRILAATEMRAFLITVADESSVELVNGTDFTVGAVGGPNTVCTTTATYSSAYELKFLRTTARTQLVDYLEGAAFPAETHEEALDRLTHIAQEQDAAISRAITFPEPEAGQVLPSADERANKLLAFGADGALSVTVPAEGSASELAVQLADATMTTRGAGMIGYDALLAYAAGTVGAALNSTWQVTIPLTVGMSAQARADMINDYAVTYAGKASLVIPVHPSGPTTLWTIEEEIMLPSRSHLKPQVWRSAGLKLSDTALATQNVITNASNDKLERSTQDQYIIVEGLLIDGNGSRTGVGSVGANVRGCGIGLSGVKWGLIRGNMLYGGFNKHCIDVGGSVYNLGTDTTYPDGPSEFVTVVENDCEDAADDCITTHSSNDVLIERNVVRKLWSTTLAAKNSNGIEVDDCSLRVTVRKNRIEGGLYMSRGVEVKGHSTACAARDVIVEGNHISNVVVGLQARHLAHGDGVEPDSPTGFNVQFLNNTIWDIGLESGNSLVDDVVGKAIDIQSYDGVLVQGNVCLNENSTFDADGSVILMHSGAKNVTIFNNEFRGFDNAGYAIRSTSEARGGIKVSDNIIENSGKVAAIYLNSDNVGGGGNRITWTGTPSGTDVAVWLDSTSSVEFKEPNSVDGYTAALKVGATTSALTEPLHYAPRMTWATGPAVKASLETNGDYLVGADAAFTLTSGTTDGFMVQQDGLVRVSRNNDNALGLRRRLGDGRVVEFLRDTSIVGNISVTTTATAFNTSSDRRLKENIVDYSGSGAVMDALQPRSFTWKVNGAVSVGFIADELQGVVPLAVTGQPNAVVNGIPEYQSVDFSRLVPYLVAEVKALRARVAALESP